jgi:hypothetical protein
MTGHSENIDLLSKALVAAWAEFPSLTPDATGQVGQNRNYRYASLDQLIETVKPILKAHGLVVIQPPESGNGDVVQVSTVILHESGQWIEGCMSIPATQQTPQQFGSAMTYARRYSLAAMLNLGVEDDDGAAASKKPRQTAPQSAAQPQQRVPLNSPSERMPGGAMVSYEAMTPTNMTEMGRKWFHAKLKEMGETHESALVLLEVQSFSKEMPNSSLGEFLYRIEEFHRKMKVAP